MDSKEIKSLMEAYAEVYAPKEIDERFRRGGGSMRPASEPELSTPTQSPKPSRKGGRGKAAGMAARMRFMNANKEHAKQTAEELEVNEAVKGADPEMRRAASAERRAGDKRLSPSKAKGYAAHAMQQAAYVDKKTKGKHIPGYAYAEEVEQIDEISDRKVRGMLRKRDAQDKDSGGISAGYMARVRAQQAAARRNQRTGSNVKVDPILSKEEFDIFDVVLEFLQAEGYAETLEEAEWLMANVINEEAIDIILGEAQAARENPEKYEREQAKKTSKREKAMNDPHKGINSPAFAEFMRKQMGR